MSAATWVVVPAAGRGTRFGAPRPKQYLEVGGRPLIAWTLDALLAHPAVAGAMVVVSEGDPDWPGWRTWLGKPVLTTNMVSIWGALRMLGHREPIAGYGALLREHFHTQEA